MTQDTQRWSEKHDKVNTTMYGNIGTHLGFTQPVLSTFVDLMKGSPVGYVPLICLNIASVTERGVDHLRAWLWTISATGTSSTIRLKVR